MWVFVNEVKNKSLIQLNDKTDWAPLVGAPIAVWLAIRFQFKEVSFPLHVIMSAIVFTFPAYLVPKFITPFLDKNFGNGFFVGSSSAHTNELLSADTLGKQQSYAQDLECLKGIVPSDGEYLGRKDVQPAGGIVR